jgi:hypothetical protein
MRGVCPSCLASRHRWSACSRGRIFTAPNFWKKIPENRAGKLTHLACADCHWLARNCPWSSWFLTGVLYNRNQTLARRYRLNTFLLAATRSKTTPFSLSITVMELSRTSRTITLLCGCICLRYSPASMAISFRSRYERPLLSRNRRRSAFEPYPPQSSSQATIYLLYREEDRPTLAPDSSDASSISNSTGLPCTRAGASHVG